MTSEWISLKTVLKIRGLNIEFQNKQYRKTQQKRIKKCQWAIVLKYS